MERGLLQYLVQKQVWVRSAQLMIRNTLGIGFPCTLGPYFGMYLYTLNTVFFLKNNTQIVSYQCSTYKIKMQYSTKGENSARS